MVLSLMSYGEEITTQCCPECGRSYEAWPCGVSADKNRFNFDGVEITLSPMLAAMLRVLLRSYGKVVTKEAMFFKVWGLDSDTLPKTLDVQLVKLRHALHRTNYRIITQWGGGLMLKKLELPHND